MTSLIRAAWSALLLALVLPFAAHAADAPVSEGYTSNVPLTTSWSDLIVPYGAMAGTAAFVHNIGTTRVVVFFTASASAPSAGGIVVKPGETLTGSAAHVWVRSIDAAGVVTVGRLLSSAVGQPSASAEGATTATVTPAAASSIVAKASPGTVFGVNVTTGASAGYLLLFNATSAPADGAVSPARCLPIAANVGVELNFRPVPLYYSTGITAVFSTTGCFTKTASATAFIAVDAK